MSHYEKRLEQDLTRIKDRIEALAKDVQDAVENAVHALVTGNHTLAYRTILHDLPINRYVRQTEKLCNAFLAVHLPTAGPLRLISSVMRINIALERIGDYAVTLCRQAVQLSHPPQDSLVREVSLIAEEARHVFDLAMQAFHEGNAEKAKATKSLTVQTERTFETIYADLLSKNGQENIKDLFGMLVIFSYLGRISDQARNICEDTVFAVTGETKPPKIYHILFLDENNAGQSQMAEAIVRKMFPRQGRYVSAGRQPSSEIDPRVVTFLEKHGVGLTEQRPKKFDFVTEELAAFHVIVSLQGPVKSYIKTIPFHTVALEWDVGSLVDSLDPKELNQRFEEMYREIALQVRDLMDTLRGDEGN